MAKMYSFWLNANDFLSSPTVAMMNSAEVGAYFLLLLYQWQDDCLPDNDETLRRLTRLDPVQWQESRDIVLSKFPVDADGKRRNHRLHEEYLFGSGKSEQAKEAARIRWESKRNADAMLTHSDGIANAMPKIQDKIQVSKDTDADKKKEKTPVSDEPVEDEAQTVYDYYKEHVKAGKMSDAMKSIKKLFKAGLSRDKLIDCIRHYTRSTAFSPETRFRIQANNFFGMDERWKEFEHGPVIEKSTSPATDEKGSTWKQLSSGQWQETTDMGDVIVWDAQKKYQETINGLQVF